jgi:hypothetical protein
MENKLYVAYSTPPNTRTFTSLLITPLQTLGSPVIPPSQSQESKDCNFEDMLHTKVLYNSAYHIICYKQRSNIHYKTQMNYFKMLYYSTSHGNYVYGGQKCGNTVNGVHTLEGTEHTFVNVTIRWGYT